MLKREKYMVLNSIFAGRVFAGFLAFSAAIIFGGLAPTEAAAQDATCSLEGAELKRYELLDELAADAVENEEWSVALTMFREQHDLCQLDVLLENQAFCLERLNRPADALPIYEQLSNSSDEYIADNAAARVAAITELLAITENSPEPEPEPEQEPAVAEVSQQTDPEPPRADERDPGNKVRGPNIATWVLLGGAAAGGVLGAIENAAYVSAQKDAEASVGAERADANKKARSAQTIAVIGYGVGGAALIGAVVTAVIPRRAKDSSASLAGRPVARVVPEFGGASFVLNW